MWMYTNICCLNDMREDFRKDFYFNVRYQIVCLLVETMDLYYTSWTIFNLNRLLWLCVSVCLRIYDCMRKCVYSKSCKQKRACLRHIVIEHGFGEWMMFTIQFVSVCVNTSICYVWRVEFPSQQWITLR